MERRTFIRYAGLSATGLLAASRLPLKGLPLPVLPAVDLYGRGKVTTYLKSRNELRYIGMPVGGINCGTVYLGGDGRLWLWDIFNKNQEGIEPKEVAYNADVLNMGKKVRSRDGACYLEPSTDIRPLDQGFSIELTYDGQTITRALDEQSWPEISFEATYPMATIRYTDPQLPVSIVLEAFSPFIPLEEDDSGLPVTLFVFQLHNHGKVPVTATLKGWLENKAALYNADDARHERVNEVTDGNGWKGVSMGIRGRTDAAHASLTQLHDYGNCCIAAFHTDASTSGAAVKRVTEKLNGTVQFTSEILPGKDTRSMFGVSWYFPNLLLKGIQGEGRYYANRFNSASAVMAYVQANAGRLEWLSRLWKNTWYDSSLPWWFQERTFLNISTLATTTCHRFRSGRFYAWEGVGACEGTCTHVWQYAQAVGRIFPALERDVRERTDLGLALMPDGGILFRGEAEKRPAIDGQAGTVLRIYREHQMSRDAAFLQRNWPNTKRAIQFIIRQDRNGDGLEDTPMENTLDAIWDGEIAWIAGLCIAAVKAGALMAEEMNDTAFTAICRSYVDKGSRNMETHLFNGTYFIHRPDPVKGRSQLGSYNTCHIDQVYGQSWAFQTGMGRILDKKKTLSALQALWKYNFKEDVGQYIKTHPGGRPYALPGEGGMIMNTNPANEPRPFGDNVTWQLGYFHECMTGFEHQVASHMMAEGMVKEALTLTRAIHDRYHAAKRNPFNEIECSDHYARAMASYGTFITACGFNYHGPKGTIRFAPALGAARFKAPFVTAEGWGTYQQQYNGKQQEHSLDIKYGSLQLNQLSFTREPGRKTSSVKVFQGEELIAAGFRQEGSEVTISLQKNITLTTDQPLKVIMA